jgi:hypothetical protein
MPSWSVPLSALKEILDAFDKIPDEERENLRERVLTNTAKRKWFPNPGPQTEAYFCQADELFYGGQAGGGKSALICGLSVEEHERSLILRRINKDAKKLAEAELLGTIFGGDRNGWNGSDLIYRAGTKVIEFSGCENEQDKQRFKGDPHDLICVGHDTPVLMADGSYRPIQNLRIGDLVQTVEGGRKVERLLPIQDKPCVRMTCGGVSQVQSTTHPLLTIDGWLSVDDLGAAYESSQSRDNGMLSRSLRGICESASNILAKSIHYFARKAGLDQPSLGHRCDGEKHASDRQSVQGSAYAECCDHSPRLRQPALSFFQLERLLRPLASALLSEPRLAYVRGASGVHAGTSQQDCQGGYWFEPHPCDGQPRQALGRQTESRVFPQCLLLRDGVEQPIPSHWLAGALGRIRKRIPGLRRTYAHPYTGDTRRVGRSGYLSACNASYEYVGNKQVYDLQVEEVNHYITRGGIVNRNCFDEVTDFVESQYVFISTWNRSTNPNQRCRIVATGNPPTTAEGLWVIKRWAPWLDPRHPKPAKPGELRWFISDEEGEDVEVEGPGTYHQGDREVEARSRTFIPAELSDNPDLAADGEYQRLLDSLPKELRDAYRDGRFDVGLKDNPWQAIPTQWVQAAMDRWTQYPPQGVPMCAMGLDVAQGGEDANVLASRYDGWYSELIRIPGRETPLGVSQAGLVISHRKDQAKVIVDCDGGYGGTAYKDLKDNGVDVTAYKGSEGSKQSTDDKTLKFANKRSQTIWRFREALDPAQPGGSPIFLPNDTQLLADLTATRYQVRNGKIHMESKEDIKKRLGRSPDDGDAVTMCWSDGAKTATHYREWHSGRRRMGRAPKVVMGNKNRGFRR